MILQSIGWWDLLDLNFRSDAVVVVSCEIEAMAPVPSKLCWSCFPEKTQPKPTVWKLRHQQNSATKVWCLFFGLPLGKKVKNLNSWKCVTLFPKLGWTFQAYLENTTWGLYDYYIFVCIAQPKTSIENDIFWKSWFKSSLGWEISARQLHGVHQRIRWVKSSKKMASNPMWWWLSDYQKQVTEKKTNKKKHLKQEVIKSFINEVAKQNYLFGNPVNPYNGVLILSNRSIILPHP